MRVFSCILASIALLSACQPQSVTTEDGAVITVTASVPETIDTDTILELTFSDPIPASADLRDYISVSPFIDGTFAIATDGLSATFAPTPGWEPGVSYTVSVEDDAAFGNDTLAASSWTLQSPGWTDPAEQFATDGNVQGLDIATDAKGYLYVLGSVFGSEFEGITLGTGNYVFVQKLTPSGQKLWTKIVDVNGSARIVNFEVKDTGEIIFGLTVDSPLENQVGPPIARVKVVALDANGDMKPGFPWTLEPTDSTKLVYATGTHLSESGDVYVWGNTTGSLDGSQTGYYFVAKYSSSGSLTWVTQIGDIDRGLILIQMALDSNGNAYFVANGTGDFEGSTHDWTCGSDEICNSAAIVKIDAQGNLDWIERFGQDYLSIWAETIIVNARDEVIAGYDYYITPENPDPSSTLLNGSPVSANNGVVMVRFDAAGNHLSTHTHGVGNDSIWPLDMILSADGSLLSIGDYFEGNMASQGWLAEWDAQGVMMSQRFYSGVNSRTYGLRSLTRDPWGRILVTGHQPYNTGSSLVIRELSFE